MVPMVLPLAVVAVPVCVLLRLCWPMLTEVPLARKPESWLSRLWLSCVVFWAAVMVMSAPAFSSVPLSAMTLLPCTCRF